jgi:transcriptional regulator with XRE-family HTH domain
MITRIRDVRRARRMTLQDVAGKCEPPTTPQTIGRLETGTRTVSVGWLNRIAAALGVDAAELVELPQRDDIKVAATIDHEGAHAPRRRGVSLAPCAAPGTIAVSVSSGVGEYRSGDQIWCDRIEAAADYARALNRDILVPRPAGRFLFGRLIGREEGKLHLLPLGVGQRQIVVADPPWVGVAVQLIRGL